MIIYRDKRYLAIERHYDDALRGVDNGKDRRLRMEQRFHNEVNIHGNPMGVYVALTRYKGNVWNDTRYKGNVWTYV